MNKFHNFFAISISYEKAHTEVRGKYAFFPQNVVDFAAKVKAENAGKCFVISTCNRTEIYANTKDTEKLIAIYCEFTQGTATELKSYIEVFENYQAIQHLFRVSSGLESQILGDFEVLGQLKTWFRRFKTAGITNSFLEKLVNTSIQISKKIKHQTSLSNGAASVSYAAVNYILQNVNDCKHKNITLLGTGKIGQNTCENLIKHTQNTQITLVNRTEEKAEKLAEKLLVKHRGFADIKEIIAKTDILIVATASEKPLITQELLSNEKILIIDLSIPENVSREVKSLQNVTLLNVDELSAMIDETLEKRKTQIPIAENIIAEHLKEIQIWQENRQFAPTISAFKDELIRLNSFNYKELKKNNPQLNGKETLLSEKLAQKITNRFADFVVSNPEKANETIALMKEMFHLQ